MTEAYQGVTLDLGNMSPAEAARLADGAQRLLNDPLLWSAVRAMQGRAFEVWRTSAAGDVAKREQCWQAYVAAQDFELTLRKLIESATLAARNAEAEAQQRAADRLYRVQGDVTEDPGTAADFRDILTEQE